MAQLFEAPTLEGLGSVLQQIRQRNYENWLKAQQETKARADEQLFARQTAQQQEEWRRAAAGTEATQREREGALMHQYRTEEAVPGLETQKLIAERGEQGAWGRTKLTEGGATERFAAGQTGETQRQAASFTHGSAEAALNRKAEEDKFVRTYNLNKEGFEFDKEMRRATAAREISGQEVEVAKNIRSMAIERFKAASSMADECNAALQALAEAPLSPEDRKVREQGLAAQLSAAVKEQAAAFDALRNMSFDDALGKARLALAGAGGGGAAPAAPGGGIDPNLMSAFPGGPQAAMFVAGLMSRGGASAATPPATTPAPPPPSGATPPAGQEPTPTMPPASDKFGRANSTIEKLKAATPDARTARGILFAPRNKDGTFRSGSLEALIQAGVDLGALALAFRSAYGEALDLEPQGALPGQALKAVGETLYGRLVKPPLALPGQIYRAPYYLYRKATGTYPEETPYDRWLRERELARARAPW